MTLTILALSGSLHDKTEYQRASKVSIAQSWTNFHAFSALLASSGIFGEDFGLVSGLAVIVAGLETKSPTSWERERSLPAALQWFSHASKMIYRDGRSMGTEWDSKSESWNGQAGFNKERWKFWKDRLEEIQKDDAIDEEMQQLLRTVGVVMGKAERAKKMSQSMYLCMDSLLHGFASINFFSVPPKARDDWFSPWLPISR